MATRPARCSRSSTRPQNTTFRDHYLDLPFDLSKVLFVCTANQLETIPGPLIDRMDVIQLTGYTEDEKLQIGKRYLVPKQLEAHGLDPAKIEVDDAALRMIIREYTREAGVRSLERRIADLCRKAARKVADGYNRKLKVDEKRAREWLGPRRFAGEVRKRTSDPGVATGLAVTAVGGDVLFIEATAYPGSGRLIVTGQLGEVMQESAHAALSWVRSHAERLGLDPGLVLGRTTSTSTSRPAPCRRTGPRRGSRSRRRSSRSRAASRCRATSR